MPELFGLPHVTFLQAVGLLVLCHLLFRGHALGGRARRLGSSREARRARFLERVREHLHGPEEGEARVTPPAP
jgi:hypothetical protein